MIPSFALHLCRVQGCCPSEEPSPYAVMWHRDVLQHLMMLSVLMPLHCWGCFPEATVVVACGAGDAERSLFLDKESFQRPCLSGELSAGTGQTHPKELSWHPPWAESVSPPGQTERCGPRASGHAEPRGFAFPNRSEQGWGIRKRQRGGKPGQDRSRALPAGSSRTAGLCWGVPG